MRDEHGMLREVYISGHDFCHTFRSSMECLGRYTFALCFFFAASFTASFAAFREALSFAASFAAFRQLLCHTLCAQKQIDKNTWFYKDNDNDNNNTRTNTSILHKQYSRPSGPAQIPPHLLPTAPAPSRKLSLSIFGSTTRTGVALFGAQHSRRSGTAQIPRYLLPSAPAPSMKLSLSVFGSTNEA